MLRRLTLSLTVLVAAAAFTACGPGNTLPKDPQIISDRASLGFGQENGSGTYVGTEVQDSLQLENKGQNDLVISSVTKDGDSVFRFVGPSQTTITSGDRALITVYFKPTAATTYAGHLVITSNAGNSPTLSIDLSGKGIAPPEAGQQ